MIKGGKNVYRTISLDKVQKITKRVNHEILSHGMSATVGSASYKWSCNKGHGCQGNWWGNTGISFYTVHYYSWMVHSGNQFDPFSTTPQDWGLPNGMVLIGESPSYTDDSLKHGKISVKNQFYLGHKNLYLGVMPWSAETHKDKYNEIDAGLHCSKNWNSC